MPGKELIYWNPQNVFPALRELYYADYTTLMRRRKQLLHSIEHLYYLHIHFYIIITLIIIKHIYNQGNMSWIPLHFQN